MEASRFREVDVVTSCASRDPHLRAHVVSRPVRADRLPWFRRWQSWRPSPAAAAPPAAPHAGPMRGDDAAAERRRRGTRSDDASRRVASQETTEMRGYERGGRGITERRSMRARGSGGCSAGTPPRRPHTDGATHSARSRRRRRGDGGSCSFVVVAVARVCGAVVRSLPHGTGSIVRLLVSSRWPSHLVAVSSSSPGSLSSAERGVAPMMRHCS